MLESRDAGEETARELMKCHGLQWPAAESCRGPWTQNFPEYLEEDSSALYSTRLEKRRSTQPCSTMCAVSADSFLLQNVITVRLGQLRERGSIYVMPLILMGLLKKRSAC